MSAPSHRVRQEEDRPAVGLALWIGLIGCAVFLASLLATWILLRWQLERLAPAPPAGFGEIGRARIGMVEQRPFSTRGGAPGAFEQQRKILSRYGWVDRRRGRVHIPIRQAMLQLSRGPKP